MKTNTIENKINKPIHLGEISRFNPMIDRINRNLTVAGIKEGDISIYDGRIAYSFRNKYSARDLCVHFVPEGINYNTLKNPGQIFLDYGIAKVNGVINPKNLYFGDFSKITLENPHLEDTQKEEKRISSENNSEKRKLMELAVKGYDDCESLYLASFLTDGKEIFYRNCLPSFVLGHPKYQDKLNRTKNPLNGIDLMFEILKS